MFKPNLTAAAAAAVAALAFTVIPAQADAATAPFAHFHGGCRHWSVTFGTGTTPSRMQVDLLGTDGKRALIREDMAKREVDTFDHAFLRNGRVKMVEVWSIRRIHYDKTTSYLTKKLVGYRIFSCGGQ